MASLFFGQSNNLGEARASQDINPNDPGTQQLLTTLTELSDPQKILQDPSKLNPLKDSLNQLSIDLQTTPLKVEYQDIPNRDQLLQLAQTMLVDIGSVQANAISNPTLAKQSLDDLLAKRAQLEQQFTVATGDIVQIAKDIVDYNLRTHNITYELGAGHGGYSINSDGYASQLDCTGFINFVLFKAGVYKNGQGYNASGYFDAAKNNKDTRFKIVAYTGSPLSLSDVTSVAQPGDIVLTGSHYTGFNANRTEVNHGVIYLGNDTIAESGGSKGSAFHGPNYWTLSKDVQYNGPVAAVLRLTSTRAIPRLSIGSGNQFKVCIDQGHKSENEGGSDPVSGLKEYLITYEIGLDLKQKLDAAGIANVITRPSDPEKVLLNKERADICNNAKATFAVHIHVDDPPGNTSPEGYFFIVPGPQTPTIAPASQKVAQIFSTGFSSSLSGERTPYAGRPVWTEGVGYKVLTNSKESKIPTFFIETFNIKSSSDVAWYKNGGKDKLAEALYQGVLSVKKSIK